MSPRRLFLTLLVISVLLRGGVEGGTKYTDAFEEINPFMAWPTPLSDPHNMTSTFGPYVLVLFVCLLLVVAALALD